MVQPWGPKCVQLVSMHTEPNFFCSLAVNVISRGGKPASTLQHRWHCAQWSKSTRYLHRGNCDWVDDQFKTMSVCHQALKNILIIINVFVILSQEMINLLNSTINWICKSTTNQAKSSSYAEGFGLKVNVMLELCELAPSHLASHRQADSQSLCLWLASLKVIQGGYRNLWQSPRASSLHGSRHWQ